MVLIFEFSWFFLLGEGGLWSFFSEDCRGFFLVGSWRGWTVLFRFLGSAGNLNEGFWFWEPITVGNGKEIVRRGFLELISCSQDCWGSVGFFGGKIEPTLRRHTTRFCTSELEGGGLGGKRRVSCTCLVLYSSQDWQSHTNGLAHCPRFPLCVSSPERASQVTMWRVSCSPRLT